MPSMLTPICLYIAATCAWIALLWPYPVTVFMAASFACALLPLYQKIQKRFPGWKGLTYYTAILSSIIILPVSILVLLVVPQAAAGLNMLRTLRANNFQLPSHWIQYWDNIKEQLSIIPGFDSLLTEVSANLESFTSEAVGTIISGGVSLVGSTFSGLWLIFLFLILSIFCTIYAKRIFTLTVAISHLPTDMVTRFVLAIRGALRSVLLGVVLIALAQGILCGIGFAVAGVKQPAFWGMLATVVAPIPVVGTAIVWMPLCLMLWFTGSTISAIGLFAWGAVAVGGADNILRPLFLKQGINAPLFILVLAILCGMASFGPVGLIAGPILVSFAAHAVTEADKFFPPEQEDIAKKE